MQQAPYSRGRALQGGEYEQTPPKRRLPRPSTLPPPPSSDARSPARGQGLSIRRRYCSSQTLPPAPPFFRLPTLQRAKRLLFFYNLDVQCQTEIQSFRVKTCKFERFGVLSPERARCPGRRAPAPGSLEESWFHSSVPRSRPCIDQVTDVRKYTRCSATPPLNDFTCRIHPSPDGYTVAMRACSWSFQHGEANRGRRGGGQREGACGTCLRRAFSRSNFSEGASCSICMGGGWCGIEPGELICASEG